MQTQTEPRHSHQKTSYLPDSSCEMGVQLIEEEDYASKGHEWLSQQFRRWPYIVYQIWLIINLLIGLLQAYLLALVFFREVKTLPTSAENLMEYYKTILTSEASILSLLLATNVVLTAVGCVEMLYAMVQKKAKIAQRGLLRFQSSLISLIVINLFAVYRTLKTPVIYDFFGQIVAICVPLIHLRGGFYVLRVFKKNHPLTKLSHAPISDDEIAKEFLEQNQAIASEISKYDQKLRSCGYLVYKWWLKCAIVFEFGRVLYQLRPIVWAIFYNNKGNYGIVFGFVEFFLLLCISAWSCLKAEIAITTKALAASNQAIFWTKITTGVSIFTFLVFGRSGNFDLIVSHDTMNSVIFAYLFSFGYCCLIPILTLMGVLKAHKIIEQRDKYAQASSFAPGGSAYF